MAYETELHVAKELATEAGRIIKQGFQSVKGFDVKADRSPVTETDKRVNQLVAERLRKDFPTYALKGEEQSYGDSHGSHVWLCDPVDGTIPFVIGVPACNFMLALFVDGEAQVAVVYNPMLDLLYEAVRGRGVRCNGQQVRVAESERPDQSYLVLDAKILRESPEIVERCEAAGFHAAYTAGTGEKLMLVASGRAAAMLRTVGDPEEVGIGAFFVEEAGGKATDIAGGPLLKPGLTLTNGYIIGAPRTHKLLLDTVRGKDT